jgi:hypothetical protein
MKFGSGTATRRLGATATATVLLTMALATPVLGGGLQCALLATVGGGSATEVETGEEVLIEGTGFPFNASVEITYAVDATPIGSETVMADATGMFETSVIPLAGEEGLWTVTADVAKACTAETSFLVVAAPATPTPSPTPTPSATPAPTPPSGELPDAAANTPDGPNAAVLGGLVVLFSAVWLSRRRLAHLVR